MPNDEELLYDNPWTYEGKPFTTSGIGKSFGFVYRITNLESGRSYIGRKYFWSLRKPRGGGRRVRSESDWKRYYGSSDELNEERRRIGDSSFKREILSTHLTKGKVNYEETRQLFIHNVLTEALDDGSPAWYNGNVLGRYYKKDYFPND